MTGKVRVVPSPEEPPGVVELAAEQLGTDSPLITAATGTFHERAASPSGGHESLPRTWGQEGLIFLWRLHRFPCGQALSVLPEPLRGMYWVSRLPQVLSPRSYVSTQKIT